MKKTCLMLVCIALAGCAHTSQNAPKSLVTPGEAPARPVMAPAEVMSTPSAAPQSLTGNESCLQNLNSLQTYSPKSWNKYSEAMAVLNSKNSQFAAVRDDLSPELKELVTSAYDSKMKSLCYRIETTLGQAMISQIDPL